MRRLLHFQNLSRAFVSVVFLLLLGTAATLRAQNKYEVMDIKLGALPDTLAVGQHVNITYNYTSASDTVKLIVTPTYSTGGGYGNSANRILTKPAGSENGYVTLLGEGRIQAINFKMYSTKGALLYTKTVLVNYVFVAYLVHNVRLEPSSPRTLAIGAHIGVAYDYIQTADTIKVIVTPDYSGSVSYGNSANVVYTKPSGSGNGYVTLFGAGKVTGISFRFYSTKGKLLYSRSIKADYSYVDFSVHNVRFMPVSPNVLLPGDHVDITYDYIQSADTVKLIVTPDYSGGVSYGNSGNMLFKTPTGSSAGYVTLFGPSIIKGVTFRMYSTKGELLYSKTVDVNYIFLNFSVHNIKCTPASPDTLLAGERINIKYDYFQTADTVKVIVTPNYAGSVSYGNSPNPTYTTPKGSGTGFVTLFGAGQVEGISFRFYSTKNVLLYTKNVDLSYTFLDYLVYNIKFTPASPDTLVPGAKVSFTYDYAQPKDTVKMIVTPTYKGSSSYGNSANKVFVTKTGSSSGYVTLFEEGQVEAVNFKLYSPKGLLLYTKSVPVNYHFKFPIITGEEAGTPFASLEVYPVPATGYVTVEWKERSGYRLEITDLQGKSVWSASDLPSKAKVSTLGWTPGIYHLRISDGSYLRTQKIQVH